MKDKHCCLETHDVTMKDNQLPSNRQNHNER